ncbi:methyltransferase FkbM family protein, putative [Campylobacter iguaniorum]|uniref:FkbM family methyltransferase n=1 Tax=Campylobacter iguaniorum TaxID=1244531 RepID=UPI00073A30CF|nr:FkbM family methyltransferase [Campylobacter iguaniorum]ALV23658.1 methyltransferase FkbM family protein, putative [Campylobacter iguaniorum]
MSIRGFIFNLIKNIYVGFAKILPGYLGKRFCVECAEALVVVDKVTTKYGILKYFCMGKVPLWRSQTLFTKEPEMIAWLERMDKNSVLWDIGANIGLYSMYAGLKGLNVYSFEPSALNVALLSKNIEINGLENRVTMFPMAVSDTHEFGFLNMSNTNWGGAFNEFNVNELHSTGNDKYKTEVVFKQGIFSYSIDELVQNYGFKTPNYIKIDVDNIEYKIIYGANKTLDNQAVKSIFVELDENDDNTKNIIDFLSKKGFVLVEKSHSEMFNDSKFNTQFNYIFAR